MLNTVILQLDEPNELEFSISIKGTTSETVATKPTVRFSIVDNESGIGMSFPTKKSESNSDMLKVAVPMCPTFFLENKEYSGNVEVIVGNRYFTPTTMTIKFQKSLQVEVSKIIVASSSPVMVATNPSKEESLVKKVVFTEQPHKQNNVKKAILNNPAVKKVIESKDPTTQKTLIRKLISSALDEL